MQNQRTLIGCIVNQVINIKCSMTPTDTCTLHFECLGSPGHMNLAFISFVNPLNPSQISSELLSEFAVRECTLGLNLQSVAYRCLQILPSKKLLLISFVFTWYPFFILRRTKNFSEYPVCI